MKKRVLITCSTLFLSFNIAANNISVEEITKLENPSSSKYIAQIGYEKLIAKSSSNGDNFKDEQIEGYNAGLGIQYPVADSIVMSTIMSLSFYTGAEYYPDFSETISYFTPRLTQSIGTNIVIDNGILQPNIGIHVGYMLTNANNHTDKVEDKYRTSGLIYGAVAGLNLFTRYGFFTYGRFALNQMKNFKDSNDDNIIINTRTISGGIGFTF